VCCVAEVNGAQGMSAGGKRQSGIGLANVIQRCLSQNPASLFDIDNAASRLAVGTSNGDGGSARTGHGKRSLGGQVLHVCRSRRDRRNCQRKTQSNY
jgi:hypothetical protein